MDNKPKVSVIIPSLDGYRQGNVPRLLEDIRNQDVKDLEVHVIKGIAPNGRARNVGTKLAKGEFLVFIDDDVRLGNDKVIGNLIRLLEENADIGLAGPSQLIPEDEDSNWFQRATAEQLPRAFFPVVDKNTQTDMVTHMCLAIRKEFFLAIGQENELLISGTDPDLRYRVRAAGKKIAVPANTWAYHPLPKNLRDLLRLAFIKGRDSAWVWLNHPDLSYDLDSGYKINFLQKRPLYYRIFRSLRIALFSLFSLKWIYLLSRIAYSAGWLDHLFTRKTSRG